MRLNRIPSPRNTLRHLKALDDNQRLTVELIHVSLVTLVDLKFYTILEVISATTESTGVKWMAYR